MWQDVKSSNVKQIRWEPETKVLSVRFHSGDVYHYGNVSSHEHEQLRTAPSIGRAVRALGQDKRHPYHKERRQR